MRFRPPSAWIEKHRPTVRYPAGPWNPTFLSPKQSNLTLAERHCDGPPPPSAGVIVRSTRPLAGRTNYKIPLASPTVTKQACEELWITNCDSLIPCVYHATEPLPPVTACDSSAKESISRRLWRKLIFMQWIST
jgi:hypothetical protein